MRSIIFLIFCFLNQISFGQDKSVVVINKLDYKITYFKSDHYFDSLNLFSYQIIFGKNCDCKPLDLSLKQVNKFDESIQRIIIQYFSQNLKIDEDNWKEWFIFSENSKHKNYVLQNLKNSNRQVFSCISDNGDKLIYVEFYPKRNNDDLNKPDKDLIFVFGGGADYYSIIYNLSSEKLVDFKLNSIM
jgi:hypothetical protein